MKQLLIVCIVLMLASSVIAGISYDYTLGSLDLSTRADYTEVKLHGSQTWGIPGEPALPWFGVKLLLPLGSSASEIHVKLSQGKTIELDHPVLPLQPQYPFSLSETMPFTEPLAEIYESDFGFPVKHDNGLNTQFYAGHPIAFTAVCPFEYNPVRNELVYYSRITVTIETTSDERASAALNLLRQDVYITKQLSNFVDNTDQIPRYENRTTGYEYIIIHDSAKTAQWLPMKDLYAMKGFSVLMKPIQDILANTPGADSQAKIRNYLTTMFSTNSLRYVLLAGDTDIIPHRGMYVNMGTGSEVDSDIPADMYYNCLDGTWNNDNDANWGEIFEGDMVPEFAIGRICYNDDTEIANQINKSMSYQITPVEAETKTALFVGEWLWDGPTWAGDYMDEMIGGSSANGYTTVGVPSTWNISTLYDRTYGAADSWGANQIRPLLSLGPNLVNHLGHSNTTYNMRLGNNQVSSTTITNNGANHNYSLYFSQGCYAGAFDNRDTNAGQYVGDCIAEKFTSISTAAAAMIAHSRYGWGMQGSTDGASQYYNRQYVDAIFGESIFDLGWTLVDSKIDNIPFMNNQPVMYWVDYETNLLGDPALMIWTDTPQVITAQLPTIWAVGVNNYSVQTNAPNAQFRIKQGESIVFESVANSAGLVEINLLSSLSPSMYEIYINAANFYGYQSTFAATASEMPYIICSNISTNSPDDLHQTDHDYWISTTIKNMGLNDQLAPGSISLSTSSPNITILNPSITFNALASGDSIVVNNAFQIRINGSYPDQSQAMLTFNASFDTYQTQSSASLQLNAPNITVASYQIVNSSSLINPGDNPSVTITIPNTGSGNAYSPMMLLMESCSYISLSATDVFFPTVAPGETLVNNNSFTINISEDAVLGETITIDYVLLSENDPEDTGTIVLNLGQMNYTFEPDFQNWTSAALNSNFVDQWHRSTARNHTGGGQYAAKFGGAGSAAYANSSFGALISPEMVLGVNSRLKFFHWIAAEAHTNPGYAWDGGMVEMSLNGGAWTQISPVGGYPYQIFNNAESPFTANTGVYSGNQSWQEATFNLAAYNGSARFRFVFGADGYVNAEGWYIDDVHLESDAVDTNDNTIQPVNFELVGNYPNPFNPTTTIEFYTRSRGQLRLDIYNLKGQLVKTLVNEDLPGGKHTFVWNGDDRNFKTVGSGVYLYRLTSPWGTVNSRMLMVK